MSLEPLYYFSRAFAACRSLLCSDRGPSSYGGLGAGARAGRRGEVLSAYGAAKKARLWGGGILWSILASWPCRSPSVLVDRPRATGHPTGLFATVRFLGLVRSPVIGRLLPPPGHSYLPLLPGSVHLRRGGRISRAHGFRPLRY
jgi:hypothetical protein